MISRIRLQLSFFYHIQFIKGDRALNKSIHSHCLSHGFWSTLIKHYLEVLQVRIHLISRHNPNTDIKGLKPGFRLVSNTPSWHYQPAGPMMDRSSLGCPFTLIFFFCGPCKQEQEQRQTYQHLWHKTPPSHPLSVYVFLSPTISSLPSFVPSCQCCAK